jgi:hypothetical protein
MKPKHAAKAQQNGCRATDNDDDDDDDDDNDDDDNNNNNFAIKIGQINGLEGIHTFI